MELNIVLNTTDYTVKRGATVIGDIKKLADGSVVFVSGVQIVYSVTEITQISAFMATLG